MAAEPGSQTEPLTEEIDDVTEAIGHRVRELRSAKGSSMQQFADHAGISRAMLFKIEHGQVSASVSTLAKVARAAGVPLTALFRGLDEEHDALLVKAGQGLEIAHEGSGGGRRYQDLGALRGPNRAVEPVLITITARDEVFPLFQHPGVEFLHMITGTMEYGYGSNIYHLEPGDTLQLHGEVAHGPIRMVELPIQFLSLKVYAT